MGVRAEPTVQPRQQLLPATGITRICQQLRDRANSITSRRVRRLLLAGTLATTLLAANSIAGPAVALAAIEIAAPSAPALAHPLQADGPAIAVQPWADGPAGDTPPPPGARVGPRAVVEDVVLETTPVLTYRVRPGDTLMTIARRHGAALPDLIAANNPVNPRLLLPGQTLLVPTTMPSSNGPPAGKTADLPTTQAKAATNAAPTPKNAEPPTVDAQKAPAARQDRERPAPSARGNRNLAAWQEDFLTAAVTAAQASQAATGVPASVTVAQAILESNWGRSTAGGNNYFGIKAGTKAGPAGVVWAPTKEYTAKGWITIQAPFRAYESMAQSFTDHANFFVENSRYAEAMRSTGDARRFAELIHKAGYATDPVYAQSLVRLMDTYDLYRYNRLAGVEAAGEASGPEASDSLPPVDQPGIGARVEPPLPAHAPEAGPAPAGLPASISPKLLKPGVDQSDPWPKLPSRLLLDWEWFEDAADEDSWPIKLRP